MSRSDEDKYEKVNLLLKEFKLSTDNPDFLKYYKTHRGK
jgi:hypothetical protein